MKVPTETKMNEGAIQTVSKLSFRPPLRSALAAVGLLVFASLTAVAPALAQDKSVFVESELNAGSDQTLQASVVELAKSAVSNESGYVVSSDPKSPLKLRTRLLKLGSSFILTIDRIQNDKVAYSAKMKAATADDLDAVAGRVVKAALRGDKTEDTAEIDTITEDETTRGTRRFQATRQWKFGIGPGWGSGTNTDKSGLNYVLGYVWGLDPQWDIDLSLRVTSISKDGESGALFSDFSIGGTYYFNKYKTAPFATFGFGRAASTVSKPNTILISDDTASGWSGRIGGGVKFFRTSTVNLGLEINHTVLFSESSRSKSTTGITAATVAVYF